MANNAYIDGNKIIIEVDLSTLQFAVDYYNRGAVPGVAIADHLVLARDIVNWLNYAEDDSSPVDLLFDKALENAIEQGSEGVHFP